MFTFSKGTIDTKRLSGVSTAVSHLGMGEVLRPNDPISMYLLKRWFYWSHVQVDSFSRIVTPIVVLHPDDPVRIPQQAYVSWRTYQFPF